MTPDDVGKTVKDIGDRAVDTATFLAGSAKSASQDYAGRARDVANRAGEAASDTYAQTRDRIKDAAEHLPDSASDALDAGHRAYKRTRKHLSKQVGQQPIEALLLAGAIGYLVGWAANRS